jgi:hypothetical protein
MVAMGIAAVAVAGRAITVDITVPRGAIAVDVAAAIRRAVAIDVAARTLAFAAFEQAFLSTGAALAAFAPATAAATSTTPATAAATGALAALAVRTRRATATFVSRRYRACRFWRGAGVACGLSAHGAGSHSGSCGDCCFFLRPWRMRVAIAVTIVPAAAFTTLASA